MLKKSLLTLFMIIGVISSGSLAYANESSQLFSVSPLDPETNEPQSNYYDLTVKPKETIDLAIRVYNSSDSDLDVNLALNNGATNDNGITSYLGTEKRDETLTVAFSDLASLDSGSVTIPKNGSKDISVHLAMPEESFEGQILGGIRVTSADSNEAISSNEGAAVTNNIAYTIGVVLSESDKIVAPEMNLLGVGVEQRNARNYISSNLQNKTPTIIKELIAEQKVYKKGTDKVLYESSNSSMRMAPNSNFHFGINLEDQPLIPGDYTMVVSGTADGVPFSFEKDFTIDEKEAQELNRNAVHVQEEHGVPMWIYILIALLILTILIGGYFMRKERNRKE